MTSVIVSEPKMAAADIEYNDTLEISVDDPSYFADIIAKRRLASLIMWPVILALCFLFLVFVLGRSILRRQPFKWMQILSTTGMMGFVVCNFVFHLMGEPQHTAKLWPTVGHCQAGFIFMYWFFLLANTGMLLVTFERIVTLSRSTDESQSHCSAGVAAAGLTLASLLTFVISAGTTLWLGVNVHIMYWDGIEVHICSGKDHRYPGAFYWFSMMMNLFTALLTVILLIIYVAKRATSEKFLSMDPDQLIPILVANVVFIVGGFCDAFYLEHPTIVQPYLVAYSLVLAIWLFAEGAVRRAFKPVCCPCCTSGNDEEKVGLLGHR